MKQLTCEMCGSTELVKQDGYFVCQTCGTKYSVDEAKKMMIDGTVDVQGTVKIDNTDFFEKCFANARRAREKEDWEEAGKFYNMIIQNDPNNIEAIFYSAYSKAKTSLILDDIYKRQDAFNVLKNCISILADRYDIEKSEENKTFIISIANDLSAMVRSKFVFTQWKNQNGVVTKSTADETWSLLKDIIIAFKETIQKIQKIDDQKYLHEILINLYEAAKHTSYSYWLIDDSWIKDENKIILLKFMDDKNLEELIESSYDYLEKKDGMMAECEFEAIIKRCPDERFGYIGKSVAMLQQFLISQALDIVLIAKNKNVSAEYKDITKNLIDLSDKDGTTLLMYSAIKNRLDAVRALVDMGADINIKSAYDVTALWYVANNELKPEESVNGREIARLLLDNGAEIDVKNKGGVALYNKKTDYEIQQMIKAKYPHSKKGAAPCGCYVATCVYGSYDCPQVWTLRRYRDNTLASTWYGRLFIRTYYAISPTLVKWFGHTEWFKKMWKGKLDRMVANLNAEGVEDTPYEDREW